MTTPGAGGDIEEQRGEPVGERLGPAAARPAPRRRAAGCRPARCRRRPRRPARGSTESVDTVPATTRSPARLGDRARLAGDHRLVELGLALDDHAVGRDTAAGPHEHDVAERERRRVATVSTLPSASTRSASSGSSSARAASADLGLAERLHLLPVAEQHDRDQRGQLPPEVEVEPPEAGGHRRRVRHGDGHRDQQHHPRAAGRWISAQPPARNGQPPQKKIDRAEHRARSRRCRGSRGRSRTSP